MKEVYEKHYNYLDSKKVNPTQIASKFKIIILELIEKLRNNKIVLLKTEINANLLNNKENINHTENEKLENSQISNKKQVHTEISVNYDDFEEDFENDENSCQNEKEDEDLNKLDTSELKRRKEKMDIIFNKNAISKDDPNYVHDVRVNKDFQKLILLIFRKILFKVK